MSADASIRHTILSVLSLASPYALPASQLLRDVNRQVRPPIADGAALYLHMTWLLDRRLVDFLPDELDPEDGEANRWHITEAGKTTLKQ